MLLASALLSALARSPTSSVSPPAPNSSIPSPLCVAAASLATSKCDPTATRSIADIVYSSIGVILLCTYVSVHHNIPDQKHSWWGVTWRRWRTVLCALLAPEVMILWAMRQRIMAGRIAEENEYRGWTRTHGFFIQMGGLMQRQLREGEASGVYYRVLKPEDLDNARIPYIPEKEIKDHGKGDILAKAIVIFQTTWFTIQCIVRPIQGLAIAEIELVALAFAILNAITYGLWWDKPLNIEYPIYFDEEGKRVDGPGPEDAQSSEAWYEFSMWGKNIDLRDKRDVLALLCLAPLMILIAIPLAVNSITEMVYIGSGDRASDTNNDPETSVHPFYAAKMDNTDFTFVVSVASLIGIVFGGIHVIVWIVPAQGSPELWVGRVCSLVLTFVPLSVALLRVLCVLCDRPRKNWVLTKVLHFFAQLLDVLVIVSMLAYVSSRFIILFLAIFSLRSLPDSVYESLEWTEFIPHI